MRVAELDSRWQGRGRAVRPDGGIERSVPVQRHHHSRYRSEKGPAVEILELVGKRLEARSLVNRA